MSALVVAITLAVLTSLPAIALALDVLIVQSASAPAYNEAVRGFKEVYRGSTHTILLSDYAEVDVVRLVKEEQPRVVLAVGDPALEKSKKIRQVPVVAVMALSLNLQRQPPPNIHGVAVAAAPARYLELFSVMGARRIGVLYDPARSGHYLRRAQETAQKFGLKLVPRELNTPRETLEKLDQLTGAVDAVWMLPDTTAVTAGTVEAYFTFSLKHQLPVVSFTERHLSRGAAAAIDIDRVDMGRQAAELVIFLMNDRAGFAGSAVDPRKLVVSTNKSVLQKLDQVAPGR